MSTWSKGLVTDGTSAKAASRDGLKPGFVKDPGFKVAQPDGSIDEGPTSFAWPPPACGDALAPCQGNLPRVVWADGYDPKHSNTVGSLQWQMAGEPYTPYQEITPPLRAKEIGPPT
jgi:hypothetical protein